VSPVPARRTTALDIAAAWKSAPHAERMRAVDGIGLRQLLAVIPDDWWPLITEHVRERCSPPVLEATHG
jgi:hypothetical protein